MIDHKKIILLSTTLLLLAGCGAVKSKEFKKMKGTTSVKSNPFPAKSISMETKIKYLNLVNVERAKGNNCGKAGYFKPTTPLSWNNGLYSATYEHNYDMANTNTFSHYGTGTKYDWTGRKSSLKNRIENNGYINWNYTSENIAAGLIHKTPEQAVKAWLESDYHCVNMMNPKAKEMGMSVYKKEGSEHTYYWTQNFGARR